MRVYQTLIALCILYPAILHGQAVINSEDSVVYRMNRQLEQFPQEKIYVQTDKPYYAAGERIWLNAYLLDAATHKPAPYSNYVYAELIDGKDSVAYRIKLHRTNGAFSGYIALKENTAQGNYWLRAYTLYMLNQGEDSFFRKNIRITSGETPGLTDEKAQKDFTVTLFPEGGYLVPGNSCRVAFKAIDRDGYGVDVQGRVVDEKEETVATVRSFYKGMGYFYLFPAEGKKYDLICRSATGGIKRFPIPRPQPGAKVLRIEKEKGKYLVSMLSDGKDPEDPEGFLFVHARGNVVLAIPWKDRKKVRVMDEKEFPSGVLQFVLTDRELNVLSQRTLFCRNSDQAQLQIVPGKKSYGKREKIKLALSLVDEKGIPCTGSYSVAVTDNGQVTPDADNNILIRMLLTSELRGYIEEPAFYFDPENKECDQALDALMLTQGWTRYDIPKVIKGAFSYPRKELEIGQVISGKVRSIGAQKPLKDAIVNIIAPRNNFAAMAQTDSLGNFCFQGFEFPDSTTYIVQAIRKRGSNFNVELLADKDSFPENHFRLPAPTGAQADSVWDNFVRTANEKYPFIRTIHLKDVVVSAPRKNLGFAVFANKVFEEKEIENNPTSSVIDLLVRIAGIKKHESGKNVLIRDPFNAWSFPNLVIDKLVYEPEFDLSSISLYDVERIEVYKGASATIFGPGGYGAVVITTKRGKYDPNKKEIRYHLAEISPLGFQKPAEMYTPVYDTKAQKNSSISDLRSTLYWKPDGKITPDGKGEVSFYSADAEEDYTVIVEGVTDEGKLIYQKQNINRELKDHFKKIKL